MATQPDVAPDTVTPQSPPETPVREAPTEAPDRDLPGVTPPDPDFDRPDAAPAETPAPREPGL